MHRRYFFVVWFAIALVACMVGTPTVAFAQQDQGYVPAPAAAPPPAPQPMPAPGPYRAASPSQWEWTFPEYVGSVGLAVGSFPGVPESNGNFGIYYRHLNQVDGPFYAGFEITPFSFGAIYDDNGYAAMHIWFTRAQFLVRAYTDVLMPEIYFELGIGPQYTRLSTADSLSTIEENGFARDEFGRWRLAMRVAVGLEFHVIGIEFGFTMLSPGMDVTYSVYTPTQPVHTEAIGGTMYFAVHFRFDSN